MDEELENIRLFFTPLRRRCLRIKMIEEEAKIPIKTLDHFLNNRREFPINHLEALIPILKQFGYIPISSTFV